MSRPADPVVSPADTRERIEQLREKAERHGRVVSAGDETYSESPGWNDVLFLLAVGERDRRQIARLTEALKEARGYVAWCEVEWGTTEDGKEATNALARVDAVLADEEDARP